MKHLGCLAVLCWRPRPDRFLHHSVEKQIFSSILLLPRRNNSIGSISLNFYFMFPLKRVCWECYFYDAACLHKQYWTVSKHIQVCKEESGICCDLIMVTDWQAGFSLFLSAVVVKGCVVISPQPLLHTKLVSTVMTTLVCFTDQGSKLPADTWDWILMLLGSYVWMQPEPLWIGVFLDIGAFL